MRKRDVVGSWAAVGLIVCLGALGGSTRVAAGEGHGARAHAKKHCLQDVIGQAVADFQESINEAARDGAVAEAEALRAVSDGLDALDVGIEGVDVGVEVRAALRDVDLGRILREVKAEIRHDLDTEEIEGEIERAVVGSLRDAVAAIDTADVEAEVRVAIDDVDWDRVLRDVLEDVRIDVERDLAEAEVGIVIEP